MGSKVPDNIDVVLKEAKIDPGGVVIVEAAKGGVVDEFPDLLHRTGKEKGVVDHDRQVLLFRQVNELGGLIRRTSEGLFDPYVLSILQCQFRKLEVRPDGSDDGNGINGCRS